MSHFGSDKAYVLVCVPNKREASLSKVSHFGSEKAHVFRLRSEEEKGVPI